MMMLEVHEYRPRPWHTESSLCGNREKPWQVSHNGVRVAEFATEAEARAYVLHLYAMEGGEA